MKEIKLTQGKIALVDDEDFEKISSRKWTLMKSKKTSYGYRKSPRVKGQKRKTILMHHEILGCPPSGLMYDHKDGNGLNNQRENLRFVTNRQNSQNHRNVSETSKYPGVSWHKYAGKWRTSIRIGGKRKEIGHFKNELEAFRAYQMEVEAIGDEVLQWA